MLTVAVGQAEDIDSRTAVRTALTHCKQQLQGKPPQAGIAFCNVDFDHSEVLSEILSDFPEIELIGCTSGGEFSTDFGLSDDSVSLLLFHSDSAEIRAGVGRQISGDPAAAAATAVARARKKLSEPEKLCLAFPEGVIGSADEIVHALNQILDPGCMVFGGVPSRHYETPAPTLQFYRDEILEDALPLLLFSGNFRYTFTISNSWKPVGARAKVTQTRDYEIRRIGKMRALDFYRYYLGEHRAPALEFPLAVYEKDPRHFFIRSPSDYDEKQGSIFFSSPIAEGAEVQLTEATRNRIVRDTNGSIAGIVHDYREKWQPKLALAFSCATRKLLRNRSAQPGSMAKILNDVNRHLSSDLHGSGRFMTLFYVLVDALEGRLRWVRCGHDPAIFYDPSRDVFEDLRGNGIALGADPQWRFEEYEKAFRRNGQIIFMGTDGIWETRNPRGNMFGRQPIHRIIRDTAAANAADIVAA